MSYFSRYSAYLKNNPEGYWFKRRLFGWGWIPAKREGWLTLLVFIVILYWIVTPFANNLAPTSSETVLFFIKIALWAAALIFVCYKKGEKPKWQWGLPKDSH